jgi:hypothetical protein
MVAIGIYSAKLSFGCEYRRKSGKKEEVVYRINLSTGLETLKAGAKKMEGRGWRMQNVY